MFLSTRLRMHFISIMRSTISKVINQALPVTITFNVIITKDVNFSCFLSDLVACLSKRTQFSAE